MRADQLGLSHPDLPRRRARISPGRIPKETAIRKISRSRKSSTDKASRISSTVMERLSPTGLHSGTNNVPAGFELTTPSLKAVLKMPLRLPSQMFDDASRQFLSFLV
jgi:hypothetical protein